MSAAVVHPAVKPSWADDMSTQAPCPVAEPTIRGDDGHRLLPPERLSHEPDDRVVADTVGMHDANAALLTLLDTGSRRTFDHEDDGRDQPSSLDRVEHASVQVACGTGPVAPPTSRSRANDVRGVHYQHATILSRRPNCTALRRVGRIGVDRGRTGRR